MSMLTVSEKRVVYTIPVKPNLETLNDKLRQWGLIIDPNGTVCTLGTFKNKPTSFNKLCECIGVGFETISEYLKLFPLPIQIAKGDDIHEVFETYRPGSCMRYECCRELREIYALNDDKVVVAWWKKNSHPAIESHGSALVWLGKDAYIDRMYASSYSGCMFNHTMLAIADAVRKYKPSIGTVKSVHYKTDLLPSGSVAFRLKLTREGQLPYMDSLCHCTYDSDSDTVRVSTCSGDFTAQEPDGIDARTGDGVHNCTCCNCGERIDEDDSRSNDDGEEYCESCFDELYSYCEYYDTYYPSDDTQYVEVIQRNGRVESVTYSDEALSNDYRRYEGDTYTADYIHYDIAVECGGDYFAAEDLADIDDPDADGSRWVQPYFADSHHRISDCYWSDTMGGWSIEEEDSEFMDDVRRCPVAENGVRTRSLGPAFHIEVKEFSSRFYLIHTISGNQLRAFIGDLDTALRKSAWIISQCSVELPEMWIDMDFSNDPRWTVEHGHKLRSIITSMRNN